MVLAGYAFKYAKRMLDLHLTFDIEIWCDSWANLDDEFPSAFKSYIYGNTLSGGFGLPFQLALMRKHGIRGVFFVEPLFSRRFGAAALREIVEMIQDSGQEVQLHLHTEWVDESIIPILKSNTGKRQFLSNFDRDEQQVLIALGAQLLEEAGAPRPTAFRAGGFGFNNDTLHALRQNGIQFDSSYNAVMGGLDSGVMAGEMLTEPVLIHDVVECPMTVFHDGFRLRHAQLGACSYDEMTALLWGAFEQGRQAFVILMHNFELLNRSKTAPDWVAVKRFERLCAFIAQHRDCFNTCGFRDNKVTTVDAQRDPMRTSRWLSSVRTFEQIYRLRYG